MVFCSSCGKPINDEAIFCPSCGIRRKVAALQSAPAVTPMPTPIGSPESGVSTPIPTTYVHDPPVVYDGEIPFGLRASENIVMVMEKTSYHAKSVFQLTNTFLTNQRLIFTKKGGDALVVAEFPISDIQILKAGWYNSGSKIQLSVKGSQELEDVTMLLITKFHINDSLRGDERDRFVARINELKAAEPVTVDQQRAIPPQEIMGPNAPVPLMAGAVPEPEPIVITALPPVILEEKPAIDVTKEEAIKTISAQIASLKDAIPDDLEKDWKKAVRNDDEAEIISVGKKISSYINDYVDIVTNDNLNDEEEIQWLNVEKVGVFKKSVKEKWVITNQRAFKLIAGSDGILKKDGYAGLASINVVVMNQYRKSNSTHVGTYVGRRGVGVGSGRSSSTSTSYGDLVFMSQGKELFRFPGISDPNGVKRMVEILKKQTKV